MRAIIDSLLPAQTLSVLRSTPIIGLSNSVVKLRNGFRSAVPSRFKSLRRKRDGFWKKHRTLGRMSDKPLRKRLKDLGGGFGITP